MPKWTVPGPQNPWGFAYNALSGGLDPGPRTWCFFPKPKVSCLPGCSIGPGQRFLLGPQCLMVYYTTHGDGRRLDYVCLQTSCGMEQVSGEPAELGSTAGFPRGTKRGGSLSMLCMGTVVTMSVSGQDDLFCSSPFLAPCPSNLFLATCCSAGHTGSGKRPLG